ncbi:MAG: Rieske 2Fe-2S domain-containing protein [Pirellulales bacterium]|nr:Rieske 2Fe-2S domain-containing protein [Pirellulales bacterium]
MHSREGSSDKSGPSPTSGRRGVLAFLVGAIVSVLAVIPGVGVVLDPLLRKKKSRGKFVRITTLDAVPPDGLPHRFQVVTVRTDKWNKYPPEPVDAVYVIRTSEQDVPIVFSVICPHLGCVYDFKNATGEFQCPCHTSGFALDGSVKYGPSPRGLDQLAVEIRNGGEIWVDYKKFKGGKSEQIEV